MSKVKCIIIDDDIAFQTLLKTLIKRIPELELIGVFDNSVDAVLSITREKPDIIFLDVEIKGLSGLEVLETLDHMPRTIVISGHADYKDYAEELNADSFLVKPINNFEYFKSAVDKSIALVGT